jgi:hypothetical protein
MRLSSAGFAGLKAASCSDKQLVNELCECRVGSTESRSRVQSQSCNYCVLHSPPDYVRVRLGLQEEMGKNGTVILKCGALVHSMAV